MAEGGQTDDNRILPTYSHAPDKSSEWLSERVRMVRYIVDSIMINMSPEEKEKRARASVHESLYYLPDHKLVDKYEELEVIGLTSLSTTDLKLSTGENK